MNKIYLKYRSEGVVVIEVNGKTYITEPRNQITLLVVDEANKADIPFLLNRDCGCCNNRGKCFRMATPQEIEHWLK